MESFGFCNTEHFWQTLAILSISTNYSSLKVDVYFTCNMQFMGNFGASCQFLSQTISR